MVIVRGARAPVFLAGVVKINIDRRIRNLWKFISCHVSVDIIMLASFFEAPPIAMDE